MVRKLEELADEMRLAKELEMAEQLKAMEVEVGAIQPKYMGRATEYDCESCVSDCDSCNVDWAYDK
jgi:hypothetical protein